VKRATFEASNDALIVIDGEGCIVSLNPAAERLFDRRTSESTGLAFGVLFRGDVQGAQPFAITDISILRQLDARAGIRGRIALEIDERDPGREQGYLKTIKPKSPGQEALIAAIDARNLVLALGPSLLPSPAVAGPARRVKMRVLRLDDAPKEWTARRLLVGVSIGAREIYRTPAETKPDWDKGFRVQTSRGHPVEFAVVGTSCASPGTADDTAKARRAPQRKGHGDDSPLLGGFATTLRQFETPPFEVRVLPAGAQHVLGALHEQMSEKFIAGFGDVELGFKRPGFVLTRTQTDIRAYRSGSGKPIGIFYREHKGERG